ncbi:MAG: ribosome maturation factor RimM [Alphaproteobacteria bacterium]
MKADDTLVLVGRIGAPHGIGGALRVKSFTDDPLALGAYGPLQSNDGRQFTVKSARPAKTMLVVRFAEVADRDAAEALTGIELFVPRSVLPAVSDDDEFYFADLIGLAVVDTGDRQVGTVVAVPDFGAGTLLEIAPQSGDTLFVPFTMAAVPVVDIAGRRIVIDPPDEIEVKQEEKS